VADVINPTALAQVIASEITRQLGAPIAMLVGQQLFGSGDTVRRGPGRPKKTVASPAKRGPGRPKKNTEEKNTEAAVTVAGAAPKRRPGRPPKVRPEAAAVAENGAVPATVKTAEAAPAVSDLS
jgi:hypothetical protein